MAAKVTGEVSAQRVREHVERIVTEIPHRAAGSENGRRMAEYSRDALAEAGVNDPRIHELPAIVSFPEHADFRLEEPRTVSIPANTLGHSTETFAEGISGELVYVGSGAFGDYAGLDVRGKIILTELSYSPARHEKQRIAALKGAIGAVMMNWGHPENTAVPFGSVKPAWGVPTPETYATEMPEIPCIGISRVAGLELKEMALAGSARVWFRTHVENPWRPIQITVGEIAPPAESPEADDFILLGGHQDSWPGEAATDNAAGNACKYELARAFAAHRGELRRGLMLGFWTAHETGTMSGSTWFADRYWDRLRANAVAYLQIDQPGCVGTSRWSTSSNAELKAFHQRVETGFLDGRENIWKRASKTGDASFFGLGVPMFHGEGTFTEAELKATALATLGWWHHSLENRLDKLDWDWMATHLQIYAAWLAVHRAGAAVPLRPRGAADRRPAGRARRPRRGGRARRRAGPRRDAARRLDAEAEAWAGRFARGEGDEDAARLLNRTMKRLSRILVPLQSQVTSPYGQDPYGFTPQGTMLPCLYDLPELEGAPDAPERWMLETRLVRQRNRVADGLGDASAAIDDTLRALGGG